MSRLLVLAGCGLVVLALTVAACGGDDDEPGPQLILEQPGDPEPPGEAPPPTFPNTATTNTVRVAGRDPVENAAGVASAVFPATSDSTRPEAVVLVERDDWQGGVAASVLASGELGAPLLLTDGDELPAVTSGTLTRLDPAGSELADGAQVIQIGEATPRLDRRTETIAGADPFELAAEIDRFHAVVEGEPSANVVIATGEDPAFAMPAAAWAARSGDAVLFTERDALPEATRRALGEHEDPDIYVLGPESVISAEVEQELQDLGRRVRRVEGETAVENAVEFARYDAGGFGWALVTPGHNFALASTSRPLDAAAAAALATNGTFAPLLVTDDAAELPRPLQGYFLDVQPGFEDNPNTGVFNRVWILGDQEAISLTVQARIDELAELVPVQVEEEPEEASRPQRPRGRPEPESPDDLRGRDLRDDLPDDLDDGPGGIPRPRGPGIPPD